MPTGGFVCEAHVRRALGSGRKEEDQGNEQRISKCITQLLLQAILDETQILGMIVTQGIQVGASGLTDACFSSELMTRCVLDGRARWVGLGELHRHVGQYDGKPDRFVHVVTSVTASLRG